MTKRAKTSITLILTILVAIAGFFAWTRYRERSETPVVQAERIERRPDAMCHFAEEPGPGSQ